MRDNSNINIRLVIAGFECDKWDSVSVDSQIDVPADGFNLSLFNAKGISLPPAVRGGAPVQLYYGDELVLTGILDKYNAIVPRGTRSIKLSGRDLAGQLLDCSAPIQTSTQTTLGQLIEEYVLKASLGTQIHNFIVQKPEWLKNKVSIEPGESIYDAIVKAAQLTGQHAWMREDGTLIIGDPFIKSRVIATPLQLFENGNANNILVLDYDEDVSGLFSDIKILSQDENASSILAESPAITPYAYQRLKIITLPDIDTQSEAQAAIEKIKHDNDLEAYSLNLTVKDWVIDGSVWKTGCEITVKTDVETRANARWVVLGRTLNLSRSEGKTTLLRCKRPGDWAQPLVYTPEQAQPNKKEKAASHGQVFDENGRGTYREPG